MALTVDGIPVSGSTGANTYARNRYGAYKRRRVNPVNPNSSGQIRARTAFRNAIDAWTNTLTGAQRLAWTNWAAATPWINRIGATVFLAPQVAFARTYMFQEGVGQTPVLTAPIINDLGNLAIDSPSIDNSNLLTFNAPLATNDWNVTGGVVAAYCSLGVNPSRNFRPSRFFFIGAATVGAIPTAAITITGAAMPWSIATGQRVWIQLRAWNIDNRLTEKQLYGPLTVA